MNILQTIAQFLNKINIEAIIKNPEIIKFVFDYQNRCENMLLKSYFSLKDLFLMNIKLNKCVTKPL